MRVGAVAGAVGKGLVAGVAGTAAMTLSSVVEAKLRDRGASRTPATALRHLLHVEPVDDTGRWRLNTFAHWGYGIDMGMLRGLIGAAGLRGVPAAAALFALVWGLEQITLPAAGAGPPAWKWDRTEVAIDAVHHAVYATGASLAYTWLDRH